jgi:hypothetical protein
MDVRVAMFTLVKHLEAVGRLRLLLADRVSPSRGEADMPCTDRLKDFERTTLA